MIKTWKIGRFEDNEQEYIDMNTEGKPRVGHWKWAHACNGECSSPLYPTRAPWHSRQTTYSKEGDVTSDIMICADTPEELKEYSVASLGFPREATISALDKIFEKDTSENIGEKQEYQKAIYELISMCEMAGIKVSKKYKDMV